MKITDVFTPRAADFNSRTYVPRLTLETALKRSVLGSQHSLLFGESGNGKSWLYRKVFTQLGFHYKVTNCANACRSRSLAKEIHSSILTRGASRKTSFIETREATPENFNDGGLRLEQASFAILDIDPLFEAFSTFRANIGTGDAIIVLENLEAIFDDVQLMTELGNILLLLDDPVYGEFRIKFLLVGVPNGVLEYFSKIKNIESVSNRLEELPKVSGLTLPMVETLVDNGFNKLLEYNLSKEAIEKISSHVHYLTLGVAQRVQEYCLRLAYKLDDARRIFTEDRLKEADVDWLGIGLRQAYTVIESHLNSKETTVGRRNQVIYCIGKMIGHQIDANEVTDRIKGEFPITAKKGNMGVASILAELSSSESPILRKNPKTNDYRIVDPRYLMCIRVMLFKNPDTAAIEKRAFKL